MVISKEVCKQKQYIIGLRRYFHQHPELSGKEYQTALRIEQELEALSISHFRVGETGVIGIIENGRTKDKPALALRADIDALMIEEGNEVSYKSQNPGVMHACGHDGHIAALLGAAKVLQKQKETLTRKVILIFQQAEEIGAGAKQFLATTYLKEVEEIIGIHLASFLPKGQIAVQLGESNASCDYFKIKIKGKSCHVSKPHEGVDAVYITSQIVIGLQAIASRMSNPLESVVVGIGKMSAGTNYNIIAGEGRLEGTTRAFNQETRQKVNEAVLSIAKSIGNTYGAEVEVEFTDYASPLVNHKEVAKKVATIGATILGEENVLTNMSKIMMADDFSEFLKAIKGSYIFVGSSSDETTVYPHHNEHFDIDEESLLISAELFVDYVLKSEQCDEK